MKKIYLSPRCEIVQIDVADHLLTASDPATQMEKPDSGIYTDDGSDVTDPKKKVDPWDDPSTEDDDWGY